MVRKAKIRKSRARENKILKGLDEALVHASTYTPSTPLTLCGQLEDAILLLETRISNSIAKINNLM